MRECAFTIVAKNYIGLGQILGKSLREQNPEVDFRIYVADEFDRLPDDLPTEVRIARETLGMPAEQWQDMSYKYDLTEFCTALKPYCFSHLFGEGYEKAMYFDPDIYVYSSIEEILRSLDAHSVTLTPQIAGIHVDYTGEHPEWAMNVNGIFNLGFCGIRNNALGRQVVAWWKKRLEDGAFTDRAVGQFTDQKWMDWMPGLLGEQLYVQRSLGMNMAPWNYFEREAYREDDRWMVRYRTADCEQREDRLVFVHFAGYDYAQLKRGIVARKRIEDLREYADIDLLGETYRDAIIRNADLFDHYINQTYTYGYYDNGEAISTFHRRLYHGLEDRQRLGNPYSTAPGSYYQSIARRGMITREKTDGITRRNIGNLSGKKKMLAYLFGTLYRLMGYKRYVLFLKSLYFYCRPEEHTFLIDKR